MTKPEFRNKLFGALSNHFFLSSTDFYTFKAGVAINEMNTNIHIIGENNNYWIIITNLLTYEVKNIQIFVDSITNNFVISLRQ